MIPSSSHPNSPLYPEDTSLFLAHRLHSRPGISWPAIFAGLSAALAADVVLMFLASGLGLALYTPITDENPVASFSVGAALIAGFTAVVALWIGGFVAGRFAPAGFRTNGCGHGFVMWCAATVAGVLMVSIGAGWALGDLAKIVGGGLSLAGKPVAAAVGGGVDIAKDALQRTDASLDSFTEEALGARPDRATGAVRAKREIGLAVARLFNPALQNSAGTNRAALIKVLQEQGGMTQENAESTVTEWTASYERLKADLAAVKERAELKAREAANEASKALAVFSLCSFFAFLLGAFAATWGGREGARCATKCELKHGLRGPGQPGYLNVPGRGPVA